MNNIVSCQTSHWMSSQAETAPDFAQSCRKQTNRKTLFFMLNCLLRPQKCLNIFCATQFKTTDYQTLHTTELLQINQKIMHVTCGYVDFRIYLFMYKWKVKKYQTTLSSLGESRMKIIAVIATYTLVTICFCNYKCGQL